MKRYCHSCIDETKWVQFVVADELVCSQCLINSHGRYIFVENGQKVSDAEKSLDEKEMEKE